MIKRIVACTFLVCLFIAIPLAMLGYEKVELGEPFMAFMKSVSLQMAEYKVEIPQIPKIDKFTEPTEAQLLLNFFIQLVNGLTTLINFIITSVNTVIQLLEFIFFLLKGLIQFKDNVAEANQGSLSAIAIA